MVRRRVAAYRNRVRRELQRSFSESYTSREIAGSFAVGTFITVLPTLGTGLILFVVIVALVDRVSKIALFASVLVFNPVIKWGVYGTSFWLGSLLLGPVGGPSLSGRSLSVGPDLLLRLLVGNLILAVIASIVGYVVVLRLVRTYRSRPAILEELTERTPE